LLKTFAALLLATSFISPLAAAEPDWDELRATIRTELAEKKMPGAAVAVVMNDRVVFAEGFGVADIRTNAPVTPSTRFRIGSIAKHFTASAIVATSQDQNPAITLDAPLRTWLPDLPPRLGATTFDQLLSHRSGMVDRLSELKLSDDDFFTQPSTIFSYSSPGYALAGRAAAAASKMPFEELVAARVFKPLGMTATSYDAAPGDAIGYRVRKGRARVAPVLSNPVYRPAGLLYSNANDLARYAVAFMSGAIPSSLTSELATERAIVPGDRRRYGYGTMLVDENGDRAVFHMGDEYGSSAYLKMVPEKHCAVIVLTNAPGRMFKTMDAALRLAGGVKTFEEPKQPEMPLTAADAAAFAGRYDNYQWLEVIRKGDRALFGPWLPWFARWLPLRREVVKYSDDTYGIVGTSISTEPLRVHLVRDGEGRIEYLMLMGRAFKRRA
jgi:CubicO group peptidase (beta-lactamase class C family)